MPLPRTVAALSREMLSSRHIRQSNTVQSTVLFIRFRSLPFRTFLAETIPYSDAYRMG